MLGWGGSVGDGTIHRTYIETCLQGDCLWDVALTRSVTMLVHIIPTIFCSSACLKLLIIHFTPIYGRLLLSPYFLPSNFPLFFI